MNIVYSDSSPASCMLSLVTSKWLWQILTLSKRFLSKMEFCRVRYFLVWWSLAYTASIAMIAVCFERERGFLIKNFTMTYFINIFTTFSRWRDNSKVYINTEQCLQTAFRVSVCMLRCVVFHQNKSTCMGRLHKCLLHWCFNYKMFIWNNCHTEGKNQLIWRIKGLTNGF